MSGIDGRTSSSFDALELLANPTRLQAKIDSLKAAETSARAQIELAGPASEILKIRAEIDAIKEETSETLLQARAQVEALIQEAREDALKTVKDARQSADEILAGAEKKVKEAEAISRGAKTEHNAVVIQMESVKSQRADLDSREAALQQKADALASREQELEGEKDKLAQVRELINQVV